MDELLKSVRSALSEKNYYAALFVTLALPDICAALEYGKASGSRYAAWWTKCIPQYAGFLSGNDCYALRCAILHQGKDDIIDQKCREILDHYVFLTQGPHCNLIRDCEIRGKRMSFLQLNVQRFCEDVCKAVESWLEEKKNVKEITRRIKDALIIHEPGYIHLGAIKFG